MQIQCPSSFFLSSVHDFRHSNASSLPSLFNEIVGELSSCFRNLFFWSLSLFVFRSHKTLHVEDATRTQQKLGLRRYYFRFQQMRIAGTSGGIQPAQSGSWNYEKSANRLLNCMCYISCLTSIRKLFHEIQQFQWFVFFL